MKSSLKYAHLVGWESGRNDATLPWLFTGHFNTKVIFKDIGFDPSYRKKREEKGVCGGGRLWAYKTILKELNFDLLSTQNVIILAFAKRNLHKTHS